jgi:streptogramin lyase
VGWRTSRWIGRTAVGLLGVALVPATLTADAAGTSRDRAAVATPTVTELTGGGTPGFSADSNPDGITVGPDGHIWFTEYSGPGGSGQQAGVGGLGRVNDDGSVTELVGGETPGFDRRGGPEAITTGPDKRLWFTMYLDPGRLGIVIDGKVSESTAGVRPGFTANSFPGSGPDALTAGPAGSMWFTEYADPGGLGEVTNGGFRELRGGTATGFSANRGPASVTTGPDGRIWFTQENNPGAVARVNGDGSVTELTGGVTRGFTKDVRPLGITVGPDGHIWFTEEGAPGAVGRVNSDGSVTEMTGGVTPGFSKLSRPSYITTGPDGHLWFTEYEGGRLARINDDGTVSEFAGGVTPGFSAKAGPTGITSGPDGRIWFAEYDRSGIGRITVGPAASTGEVTAVETAGATLHGAVRANGQQTVFHFQYGLTGDYGSATSSSSAGNGATAETVSAALTGLKPGATYHYRLVATNDTDTAVGVDRTFTTAVAAAGGGAARDTQAPGAPTHVRGRFASSTLTVAWAPATDNVGVDHYRLFRNGKIVAPSIPPNITHVALHGFRTSRPTVIGVAAVDAARNQGRASRLSVRLRPRPTGVPPRIPAWATRLFVFQTERKHGRRPTTPAKLPAWYPRWKAWRLDPYRISTAG